MVKSNFVIPECFVDTNLMKTLLKCEVNHQRGCRQVCKVMKCNFSDRFAVGIVDDDKKKATYVDEFEEIANSAHLSVLKHRQKAHFLIFIKPAVEKLILASVAEVNFDMKEVGLPNDLDKLKRETKDVNANSDPRFIKLFQKIIRTTEIRRLKSVVMYLKENEYKSDVEEIKKIFNAPQ